MQLHSHLLSIMRKRVPNECLPYECQGDSFYLVSKVLPMGFANSVSLAQHVHRNLAPWSRTISDGTDAPYSRPEGEIRKDRPATVANPSWRIYLDNYDLLELVKSVDVGDQWSPGPVSVGSETTKGTFWEAPRNIKKSVTRQTSAEVQGAQIDGTGCGVPYRESKILKYVVATLSLLERFVGSGLRVDVSTAALGCPKRGVAFHHLVPRSQGIATGFAYSLQDGACEVFGPPSFSTAGLQAAVHGAGHMQRRASVGLAGQGSRPPRGSSGGSSQELRQEDRVVTIGLFGGIAALHVISWGFRSWVT